jgi:alkanesulfonate monooxygenase SsuD/methylene tetrahydromethanopterin reductase-like flavin-dependent oxidoreductase (luciferase family)
MRFGAHYLPTYVPDLDGSVTNFYQLMFEQMEQLEGLGFTDLWITEHHFGYYGGIVPHPPTFLSAIARTTQKIRLGVAISVLPFHNPLDVAESYGMVDVISNGRLEMGVGRGNEPHEFRKTHTSVESSSMLTREATEIIRQAWSDEPVNFRGEFFEYHDVNVLPKPVQRPHPPMWVGAHSEDTFRWAAKNGFNLMTLPYMNPSPENMRANFQMYRKSLSEAGHGKREILGKFHIYVADSMDQAVREGAPYIENYHATHQATDPGRKLATSRDFNALMERGFLIAGDSRRCIESIRRWQEEVGLTTLSGTFYFGGMPQELALKNIRTFAERVMPAFL